MKNLRKLTAAVLAVALVLTSMNAVFAAGQATLANADKAATLKDLGLYSGQDANDPKVGLENALTTQDSLIFLSKLFGYSDTANNLTDDQVTQALAKFDDAASISNYAKNVVAYSAANGILCGSTQNDKFFVGAKDTVTAARFATFMLRQMGYTVPDYKQSVAMLAETKGSKVDATISGDLTRDVAVGMMYGALTTEKLSGKTVVADIVGDNADLKAKAEKLGIIKPEPDQTNELKNVSSGNKSESESSGNNTESESSGSGSKRLKVLSIVALNTKQVEIKFNAQMDKDSAEDEANYEIKYDGNVDKMLTNNSCKLGDDMNTVTITLDSTVQDCLTNFTKAKVIVSKDIMAANGKNLGADNEVEVEVEDSILPTVKEVKAIGERNIEITFSEPVNECNNNSMTLNPSNFKVVTGTYEYYVQKSELNLNVINLEVGTKLIEGPIAVTVNAAGVGGTNVIQDYAGYRVFKGTTTFDYVKDSSVPVVTVKSARANKVVLNFSKPVKGSNVKLYYSENNGEAYNTEATETDYMDEITFTFDKLLPNGAHNFSLVNSETIGEKLIDRYGITVPNQSLTCNVAIDTTAPVVKYCKAYKDVGIKIVFGEELDIEGATNPDSYVVKKLSDNKEIPLSATIDDSMKSVKLGFCSILEDNTEYQLLIKNYKDISGNINESDYKYSFTTLDYKNPEVILSSEVTQHSFAIAEKGKIFIVYSEAMNEEQMLDKANYQVLIDQGEPYTNLGDDDTITKVNDRIVQIYVKELEDRNDSTIKLSVKIVPIMDIAGKRLYTSDEGYSIDSENVHIEEAQLIAKNKIKIIFNKKMGSISGRDIELTNLTTPGSIRVVDCESTTVNSDGKTEAVLILDKELATDVTDVAGARIGITTIAAPSSESAWGSKLRSQSNINLEDKVAPEIVKWNHDNDVSTDDIPKVIGDGDFASPQFYDNDFTVPQDTTGSITIFFSEDIMESMLSVQTFNVTGFTITDITAPVNTKSVILTVKANANNTSIKTTVTQVSEIYDSAENAFGPSSTWAVTLENLPITF